MPLKIGKLAIFLFLFLFIFSAAYAIDDGFGSVGKIDSKHFTIYFAPQLDVSGLARQLNIQSSDELIVGKSGSRENSPTTLFSDMVDTLFMRVCDILDMQLYSFRGNIKICQDQDQLERIYNTLFDKGLHHQKSFYVYSLNTIYIAADSFKREILGHEIGHAVISRYFVVMPSVKIQEVLAGYVEFQLRNQ